MPIKLAHCLSFTLIVATLSCSDTADILGPGGVPFPAIDQLVLDGSCIRGMAVPNTTVTGELSSIDCVTGATYVGPTRAGYFEGWRMRVTAEGPVAIIATSEFDNSLDLFMVDLTTPRLDRPIAYADEGGGGTNAGFGIVLFPNTEYWIMVSGVRPEDVGTYSLTLSLITE